MKGDPGVRRVELSVLVVILATVAYVVAFPARTDYAGHFLAGAGGTLLLLAVASRWFDRDQPWAVVAVTAVAVSLGVVTEATIFRLAEFDPVDLANQSLGAFVVAAGFLDARRGATTYVAAVAGLGLLIGGFGLAFA